MTSVKNWMVGLAAGAAAMGSVSAVADSPKLSIDKQSQTVQTPTSPKVGFSYTPAAGGSSSELIVYTEGFLFCGNPGGGTNTAASLVINHQDDTLNPIADWVFPKATDIPALSYNGGVLSINPQQETSLTCLGAGVDGALASALREGVFDNGYDSSTETNYSHLVNWIPPAGFDWAVADWTQVPQDPCNPGANEVPRLVETEVCAAVTGVRPASGGATAPHARAATIWTGTDGTTFSYVFKVDARWGLPNPAVPTKIQVPDPSKSGNVATQGAQVAFMVTDAFDSTFLDSGAGKGEYCFLSVLPSTLTTNPCAGRTTYPLNGKPFSWSDRVADPSTGVNNDVRSYYVAIKRPVRGGHLSLTTPVVAVSLLVERAAVSEGADQFTGDNIVFGFMPSSSGFPWMGGNP